VQVLQYQVVTNQEVPLLWSTGVLVRVVPGTQNILAVGRYW
jgi:hypothetical protein